ncbi:MAG: UDP-N-acetylmuramoylalanyl-D-glutamyl-2,6-diaminopimelate-D-alanyl-D-alanyl ligase [uncultured bacterium (gcode 4)]|uniref:UDP-N-acetylmuramoylalanyl-D-glutamyl-2, 6-diaminopimelate-D-alanyl-D-alanyl ligase n=1 Tax=uncultured bacterium (gcode 4) TaxID=1234023 RepID=K2H2C2_9BACT|nr:MAG: UDP-N-acetylmuramoylalanyl-D-glutamyl-2,6-diaminopimelate-D-alanyl-D-alanyl ligase [uncultured bacterium (gcode 4)]
MKKLILSLLSLIAKRIINKQKPFVIWITWTVGKTTATNFVYEFLNELFPWEAYKSEFDYNWEFGLPLTILQSKSPNKNIFLWIYVFLKGIYLSFKNDYPKYLILEYGIDRAGEMEFLLDIVKPKIWIVLNVSPNHVTQFPDYNDYIKVKAALWHNSEILIYNADDEVLCKEFKNLKNANSYWVNNNKAEIIAENIESNIDCLSFDVISPGEKLNVKYSLIWGHQVYNILPIFSLSKLLHVPFSKTAEILWNIQAQKWRWAILKWVNDSSIIDWSYNGWFLAISTGVRYMQKLDPKYNKILFLGDMRELWPESRKLHTDLSVILEEWNADFIVLVWEEMNKYVFERVANALGSHNVYWFNSSRVAWEKIHELILNSEKKSVVYVKGSQNTIFLEEWIKKFLFNLQDASKLCRQSPSWLSIKEDFFSQIL